MAHQRKVHTTHRAEERLLLSVGSQVNNQRVSEGKPLPTIDTPVRLDSSVVFLGVLAQMTLSSESFFTNLTEMFPVVVGFLGLFRCFCCSVIVLVIRAKFDFFYRKEKTEKDDFHTGYGEYSLKTS